jgi:hypothetical protein
MESWTREMDKRKQVDVIYIDFKKAFDSVPHRRLLQKLTMYGISGKLHKWIEQFVTGRSQSVSVNGCLSTCESVRSGVPQGSVLGPLLFLLYVNDLPSVINCDLLMFADDLKLWKTINSPSDVIFLQENLDALQEWSDSWLLSFNTSKCSLIQLKSSSDRSSHAYYLNGALLPAVNNEKDLGVIIQDTLKPSSQCIRASTKAMAVMRRIKRAFPSLTPELFKKIYGPFVRSHLEYSVQAWRPFLQQDRILLENVQRRSTKLVQGMQNIDFRERERILQLFPIFYRQTRGDLILAYKIIRNPDFPLTCDQFFLQSRSTNLRGHPWKLAKERSNSLIRQHSFSQRVINHWNSLPFDVVCSTSVDIFKNKLDKYFEEILTSFS